MQIANALNNHIRILFNPKVEAFKLFDFLIVKSADDKYLAQIVEIYEDKFDSSQNVAKLKLFYKINENYEVMPYDNFTPNRECEIIRLKQEEIENFINQDKETFSFATNAKNSGFLYLQYDFFNKNPIILADKIENANTITVNLAKNLSVKKHTVIIDPSGVIEAENATKIKVAENFKLPLNYTTLDFVFEKCLSDASLEFQAIGCEIINAIKKYAKTQEGAFIPFNTFIKVLLEQYKVTPYPELKLLLARIKKYQMNDIFACNKKDYEVLFDTIRNNQITTLDLSGLDTSWQKIFTEYIISDLEDEVYLITRINDESFDTDLINKIYNVKKNISFIPNLSYNYKRLPSIIQYCKNYILMPSLYQRADFLDANFALCNLITDGCIIFGDSTDNLLYLARDLEPELQEKKKSYRKIALSLETNQLNNQPIEQKSLEFFEDEKESSINEIADFDENQNSSKTTIIPEANGKDDFNILEDKSSANIVGAEEVQQNSQEGKMSDELQELIDNTSGKFEDENQSYAQHDNSSNEGNDMESKNLPSFDSIAIDNDFIDVLEASQKEEDETSVDILESRNLEFNAQITGEFSEKKSLNETIDTSKPQITPYKSDRNKNNLNAVEQEQVVTNMTSSIKDLQEEINTNEDKSAIELSDEELDFFQIAKDSNKDNPENIIIDGIEYKTQSDEDKNNEIEEIVPKDEKTEESKEKKSEGEIDLLDVANQSIEANFEDILNSSNANVSELKISSDSSGPVIYSEDKASANMSETGNLEQQDSSKELKYKNGDSVIHAKYGKGIVVKTIKYDQRQLLQIDFEEAGKKLLDPHVADIQPG